MSTSETKRAAAAADAVVIIRLLTTGRLPEVTAYLATFDRTETTDLITSLGGLCAALLQSIDDTCLRHGEPVQAGSMLASLAQWDGSE